MLDRSSPARSARAALLEGELSIVLSPLALVGFLLRIRSGHIGSRVYTGDLCAGADFFIAQGLLRLHHRPTLFLYYPASERPGT